MIKQLDANPLAVFGMREMKVCPKHFEKVTVGYSLETRLISDWIYENTDGRFYLSQTSNIAGTKQLTVGFEVHFEATFFAMRLPELLQGNTKIF